MSDVKFKGISSEVQFYDELIFRGVSIELDVKESNVFKGVSVEVEDTEFPVTRRLLNHKNKIVTPNGYILIHER